MLKDVEKIKLIQKKILQNISVVSFPIDVIVVVIIIVVVVVVVDISHNFVEQTDRFPVGERDPLLAGPTFVSLVA